VVTIVASQTTSELFLNTEDARLGFEHTVTVEELSGAYPLLDVIDHAKSKAAVRIVCSL